MGDADELEGLPWVPADRAWLGELTSALRPASRALRAQTEGLIHVLREPIISSALDRRDIITAALLVRYDFSSTLRSGALVVVVAVTACRLRGRLLRETGYKWTSTPVQVISTLASLRALRNIARMRLMRRYLEGRRSRGAPAISSSGSRGPEARSDQDSLRSIVPQPVADPPPRTIAAAAVDLVGRSQRRSVVQAIAHHADAGVAQGVERMRQHRVTAVRAGLLRRLRRRERQVVTCSAPDDEEGADPIQQPEINRRRRGHRPHGDRDDGQYLVNRHIRHLHTRLPDITPVRLAGRRSGLSRPFEHLRRLLAAHSVALGLAHLMHHHRASLAAWLAAAALSSSV